MSVPWVGAFGGEESADGVEAATGCWAVAVIEDAGGAVGAPAEAGSDGASVTDASFRATDAVLPVCAEVEACAAASALCALRGAFVAVACCVLAVADVVDSVRLANLGAGGGEFPTSDVVGDGAPAAEGDGGAGEIEATLGVSAEEVGSIAAGAEATAGCPADADGVGAVASDVAGLLALVTCDAACAV